MDEFVWELGRPERERAEVAVVRMATVIAVRSSPPAVQLTLTDTAWVRYLAGYSPTVDDDVLVVQQGPGMWAVLGKLA
ncbi:hypothetical protein [uncultured Friedmanniella sp.]|uniref:hypothetical protein n=1 Tax=uncultured Friedmanniella sp. TaxID=335381 RepID=UPI0035CC71AD